MCDFDRSTIWLIDIVVEETDNFLELQPERKSVTFAKFIPENVVFGSIGTTNHILRIQSSGFEKLQTYNFHCQ